MRKWAALAAWLVSATFAAPAAAIDPKESKLPDEVIDELQKADGPLSQLRLDRKTDAPFMSVYRFDEFLKVADEDEEGGDEGGNGGTGGAGNNGNGGNGGDGNDGDGGNGGEGADRGIEDGRGVPNRVEVADSDYVVVRFDTPIADADVVHTEDLTVNDRAEIDLPDEDEILDEEGAVQAAIEAVGAGATATEGTLEAEAKANVGKDGVAKGRLVWSVSVSVAEPYREVDVAVDAFTGKIASQEDESVAATGAGAVFDPNPVATQGSITGLPTSGNADTPELTALRTEVPLANLLPGQTCLQGQWVYVTTGPKTAPEEVCSPTLDFRPLTRSDDRFEAVMAYFHIDRIQRYYQAIGFNGNAFPPILARQMRVHVNALTEQNSFFEIASKGLIFGRGSLDEAEDGDGIAHEYGHATQYEQVPGFGKANEGRALGEGFGDYMAAVNSELAGVDPFFQVCMYEWVDAAQFASTGCSRRADTSLTLPQVKGPPCNLQFHCAGQAWSSALWRLRQQIGLGPDGVSVMDRTVLASHFLLTPNAKFFDAARAVLKAYDQIYGDPNVRALIFAEFQARGFIR